MMIRGWFVDEIVGVQSGFTTIFQRPLCVLISLLLLPTSPSEPITLFTKSSYSGSLPGTIIVSAVKPRTSPRSSLKFLIALATLLRTTVLLPSTSEKWLPCVTPDPAFLRGCAELKSASASAQAMSSPDCPPKVIVVVEPTEDASAAVTNLAFVLLEA